MKNKKRVRFSISFKFITIFAILLAIFFSVSSFMIYYFVGNNLLTNEKKQNEEINNLVAKTVQTSFQEVQSNVNGYMNSIILLQDDALYQEKANLLFNDLCYRNPQIAFVYSTSTGVFTENKFLLAHPEVQEIFILWLEKQDALKRKVMAGRPVVKNISSLYNEGIICLLLPYKNTKTNQNEIVAVGINALKYKDLIPSDKQNITYVISEEGICVLHPDSARIIGTADYSDLPFVNAIINHKDTNNQKNWKDENSVERHYNANGILGYTMYVVTSFVPTSAVENLNQLIYRIILVGFFVFFLGILLILIFTRRISSSIERLVYVTQRIGQRDYKVKLKSRSHDEVGFLTDSVNQMQTSLLQFQQQNKLYEKYSNNLIAKKVTNDELLLAGVNRNATVLYVNIKDFGNITESKNAPEIVKLLNSFFKKVEPCLEKTGGIIDNFYGDSFLAVWGTATTTGTPVSDAWQAIRCALLIRIAVYEINIQRKNRGLSPIHICCGISSGLVTAGEIGFSQRSDYTLFGPVLKDVKSVREQGKSIGTDIIISKATYDLVSNKIMVQEISGTQTEKPLYAVINAIGVKGPANLEELKNFLE